MTPKRRVQLVFIAQKVPQDIAVAGLNIENQKSRAILEVCFDALVMAVPFSSPKGLQLFGSQSQRLGTFLGELPLMKIESAFNPFIDGACVQNKKSVRVLRMQLPEMMRAETLRVVLLHIGKSIEPVFEATEQAVPGSGISRYF